METMHRKLCNKTGKVCANVSSTSRHEISSSLIKKRANNSHVETTCKGNPYNVLCHMSSWLL